MFPAFAAVLIGFELFLKLFVFIRCVIFVLTYLATEGDYDPVVFLCHILMFNILHYC